jgi:hypothetical protein
MKKSMGVLVLACAFSSTAVAQTADSVGDVDSFARTPIYLGAKQSEFFGSTGTCAPALFPVPSYCTRTPAPGKRLTVIVPEVVRIDLPARVANSQLCFEVTPTVNFTHQNTGTTTVRSLLVTGARVRFRSPVLADPLIVDPNTGLPYPGNEILFGVPLLQDMRYLAPGTNEPGNLEFTRRCAGQAFSKQNLVATYGLTRAQADQVFNETISVFVDGYYTTEYMTYLRGQFHVAVFGDKR